MNIVKVSAFSDGGAGGNPAGVVLTEHMPDPETMQAIAAEVGFSETAFAHKQGDQNNWRVRYFSPESEVPFCGHATIALGAVLAEQHGEGIYQLSLNETQISVEGQRVEGQYHAALQSPATQHRELSDAQIDETLALFDYDLSQLSDAFAPAHIHAGADHRVFALKSRQDLAAMHYDLDVGRRFMRAQGLVTVMFVVMESPQLFHVRNAFASGGVLEDPATGAAAAALSGYLRDTGLRKGGEILIVQGEDMGARSLINCDFDGVVGSSIRVSGATHSLA